VSVTRAAALACALVTAGAGVASAQPRRVLVLRADGKVDSATRSRIDAAVFTLARRIDGEITQGDITFTDAAAAVGCGDDMAACGAQLVDGLGTDEVIVVMVSPVPGGEVTIDLRRIGKANERDATATVPALDPSSGLAAEAGALFAPGPPPRSSPRPAAASRSTTAATTTTTAEPTRIVDPFAPVPAPEPTPAPVDPFSSSAPAPAPVEPSVTAAPDGVVTRGPEGHRSSRLAIGLLAGGGAIAVAGVVFWAKTTSLADEIARAPTQTRADLERLQGLEADADAYALAGNIAFAGGVVLAGVGGFLLWRDRNEPSYQARLVPLPVAGGGGLAVTIGGAP
jgi:hypothetical protein